jgi:hypothetical protein
MLHAREPLAVYQIEATLPHGSNAAREFPLLQHPANRRRVNTKLPRRVCARYEPRRNRLCMEE